MASDGPLSLLGEGLNMATIAIREALETDSAGREPLSLHAAAQLFEHAGPELYRRCLKNVKTGLPSKEDSWKGPEGYSLQRWVFWEERWKAISVEEKLCAESRAFAIEALKNMERVRTQN